MQKARCEFQEKPLKKSGHNKFAEWNIKQQRIISAYERKTNLVWCDHRNKLVRKYDE